MSPRASPFELAGSRVSRCEMPIPLPQLFSLSLSLWRALHYRLLGHAHAQFEGTFICCGSVFAFCWCRLAACAVDRSSDRRSFLGYFVRERELHPPFRAQRTAAGHFNSIHCESGVNCKHSFGARIKIARQIRHQICTAGAVAAANAYEPYLLCVKTNTHRNAHTSTHGQSR